MKLGVKLPTDVATATSGDVATFAAEAERLGYDSLWVSDHIVMPPVIESDYPFDPGRRARWSVEAPWFDVIVLLSMAAVATTSIRLGTAVLVAPLRQPVVFAKQVASLDRLAGGRTLLGIGPGWMAEEFAAVGVPFERRGRLTDEWMRVVRECFTGRPAAIDGEFFSLAEGLLFEPTPASAVPLIVGGTSPAALRRAATIGDAWMGHESLATIDLGGLAASVSIIRSTRDIPIYLRLVGSSTDAAAVAALIPRLSALGVDELIVDSDQRGSHSAAEQFATLTAATHQ